MERYRQQAIPAIYCQLDFVRAPDAPALLADCEEDIPLLKKLQRIATGQACVSELENSHVLILKIELPDDILERDGTTGEVIEWRVFQWKLWDVESLTTHRRPAEAVDLHVAGIDPKFIHSLARPTSCLKMLHATEDVFDDGERKGYELTKEIADSITRLEKPLLATLKLTKMKQLGPVASPLLQKTENIPKISPSTRDSILRRDKYRCVLCGQDATITSLEVNHIIPRSLINKLHLDTSLYTCSENLCVTCFSCNRGKSDKLAREDIAHYLQIFAHPGHPNHSLLVHLRKISELQEI